MLFCSMMRRILKRERRRWESFNRHIYHLIIVQIYGKLQCNSRLLCVIQDLDDEGEEEDEGDLDPTVSISIICLSIMHYQLSLLKKAACN